MEQHGTALPNAGRQFELDFAKFIAIVCMILVHCYDYSSLYLSSMAAHVTSSWGLLIEFLGAQPAAPVFMFCMGVGLVYTRHNTAGEFARRGVKLLVTGYLLNLYRTLFVTGGGLAGALGTHEVLPMVAAFALCVDILPFAGLAFLFFALMKRLNVSHALASLVVLALLLLASVLPTVGDGKAWYSYLAGLLWYQNDFTSFPLMQWLPFPMAGVICGTRLKAATDKGRFYWRMLAVGVAAFAVTTLLACYRGDDLTTFFTSRYFDMNLLRWTWSLGIVLMLLPIYYFLVKDLAEGWLTQLATFCSRNINKIYLWQWILITPISLLALAIFPIDSYWKLALEVALVFAACIFIVAALSKKKPARH